MGKRVRKELIELENAINNITKMDILNKQELVNLVKKYNFKEIVNPKQKEEILRKIYKCMYKSIYKRFYKNKRSIEL